MVEFVIVLPFMLFLIFMIAYAGIGFERYSRVTNAARVAARAAAVARFDGKDPCVAAQDAANYALHGLALTVPTDVRLPGGPPGATRDGHAQVHAAGHPDDQQHHRARSPSRQGNGARRMSTPDLRLLREERGQSIVLFVITFTALMGLLALVVNVGNWLQNQRQPPDGRGRDRARGRAAEPRHIFASSRSMPRRGRQAMADDNWPVPPAGVQPRRTECQDAGPGLAQDRIVSVEHDVGYLFNDLLASLGVP